MPIADTADAISTESMRDLAYKEIKERIITCEFGPGTHINESALIGLIGIGRLPVHRALERLSFEGLIEVIPRKGVVVRPIVLQEVLEIAEMRMVNECHAVRIAAERARKSDLRALSQTIKQARQAIAKRDVRALMTSDREFHARLAAATGNVELAELLRRLHERTLRFWFISFRSDHHRSFQEEHEAILSAVAARDGDRAAEAMSRHVKSFQRSVDNHMTSDAGANGP